MQERHEKEQYFFTDETTEWLADFAARFPNPCCICAPSVGVELARRRVPVRILDIDERFAKTPGFRRYDLFSPDWLGEEFGLILCDPPFFNVSLSQLFAALRLLSRNRYEQPLLISYLSRRATSIVGTFARFGLTPLTLSHEQVWQAGQILQDIVASESWRDPRYAVRNAVT